MTSGLTPSARSKRSRASAESSEGSEQVCAECLVDCSTIARTAHDVSPGLMLGDVVHLQGKPGRLGRLGRGA